LFVCLFVCLFCLALKIDDADSSLYAAAFLMNANEAAGHISKELSDHVLNDTFFLVCVSPIMQVAHAQDVRHSARRTFVRLPRVEGFAAHEGMVQGLRSVTTLQQLWSIHHQLSVVIY
jgi:hypothetical protein